MGVMRDAIMGVRSEDVGEELGGSLFCGGRGGRGANKEGSGWSGGDKERESQWVGFSCGGCSTLSVLIR